VPGNPPATANGTTYFVNASTDASALMVVRGADFLSAFDKPLQDALAKLLLRLRDFQFTPRVDASGCLAFFRWGF
jgi:hypothetical protein